VNHPTANSIRYFTLSLRPARGFVHPADDALAAAPDLTREALSYISIRDGTGVLYYRLRGDSAILEEILGKRSDVVLYDTIGEGGVFDLYLRVRIEDRSTFEECFFGQGLVIDLPVTFVGRGLRITLIGTSEMVRRTMNCLPNEVTCSVERLGGSNDDRLLLSTLTDRQREVIETAFGLGYYEIPRRTTHEEIAAALDLSGSTIDEHLRKAEFRLMDQLLS
jgi:predicted DNA binding protein